MKKILALLISCAMLALTACGTSTVESLKEKKIIRIGVLTVTDAKYAQGSEQEKQGVYYANSTQNTLKIGNDNYTIELVQKESSLDGIAEAANQLAKQGVCAIIGPYGTSNILSVLQSKEKMNIPLITECYTDGSQAFNYYPTIQQESELAAKYSKDHSKNIIAVMTENNETSTEAGDSYIQTIKAINPEALVITYQISTDTKDLTEMLTEVINSQAEILYAPISIQSGTLILNQLYLMQSDLEVLSWSMWENDGILEAAKETNVVITSNYDDSLDDSFVSGFAIWQSDENEKPTAMTYFGYEAYKQILKAIEEEENINTSNIGDRIANQDKSSVLKTTENDTFKIKELLSK